MTPLDTDFETAIYLYAVRQLHGVGSVRQRQILRSFPGPDALRAASAAQIRRQLGSGRAGALIRGLEGFWDVEWVHAKAVMTRHVERGIMPIPITSEVYPPLLKRTRNPPPILFARGKSALLSSVNILTIVGAAVPNGRTAAVADRIAQYFARTGQVVATMLRPGICQRVLEALLEIQHPAVAVLQSSFDGALSHSADSLAEAVSARGGLVITSVPLGNIASSRQAARIVAGVSPATIAISPDRESENVISVAQEQGRLLLAPKGINAYAQTGPTFESDQILQRSGVREFNKDDYPELLITIPRIAQGLLDRRPWPYTRIDSQATNLWEKAGTGEAADDVPDDQQERTSSLEDELIEILSKSGLVDSPGRFDRVIRRIRHRIFPADVEDSASGEREGGDNFRHTPAPPTVVLPPQVEHAIADLNGDPAPSNDALNRLRLGGRDALSEVHLPTLAEWVEPDILQAVWEATDDARQRARILRWVLRGLEVRRAIRKVCSALESQTIPAHQWDIEDRSSTVGEATTSPMQTKEAYGLDE
jgi:predicted Rossmann fold nucleotide-binding protein DprA/Smf involved in DNA uptake